MALRSSAAPARPTQVASGPTIGLRSVLDSLSNLCSIAWFGGTWHGPEVGRPIAASLERCAELLGVDLATVHELAGKIEPYVRADGTRIWSLMQLERQLRPEAYVRRRGRLPRPSIPSTSARLRDLAGQSVIGARERPPLIIWRCANNKDQTVAAGPSIDPTRWQQTLDELLGRIAGHFARVEPRRRAAAFVCGLLAELPRKNCWTLAEHAGDPTPDGMQHLLSGAVWDEHAVRDDVRDYVVEHLGDPQGVLVVDESGDCKKGTATAGWLASTPAPAARSTTPRSRSTWSTPARSARGR